MTNKFKNFKQHNTIKGITLIALVITIIVLLILAGVSIATLTGQDNLIKNAATARDDTEIQQTLELVRKDIMAKEADEQKSDITTEEFKEVLSNYFNLEGVTDEDLENSTFELTTKNGKHKITIAQIYNKKPSYSVPVDPDEINTEIFSHHVNGDGPKTITIDGFKEDYISTYYKEHPTEEEMIDRLVIPEKIDDYTVTEILFKNSDGTVGVPRNGVPAIAKNIILPNSIKKIRRLLIFSVVIGLNR